MLGESGQYSSAAGMLMVRNPARPIVTGLAALLFTCLASAPLLTACDAPELPSAAATSDEASTVAAAVDGPDELTLRSRRLALELTEVRKHLTPNLPTLHRFRKRTCADSEIRQRHLDAAGLTLELGTRDVRYQAKQLLPLELTDPLTTRPLEPLRRHFARADGPFDTALHWQLASSEAGDQLETELEHLSKRAYMGLFHITAYRAPHLILQRGQRKRHWTPGVLVTWLVIYDMERAEPICQVNLSVQNDVREASLRWRDRAHTQQTLIEGLGTELRDRADEALKSISSELGLPHDDVAPSSKPTSARSHGLDPHRG